MRSEAAALLRACEAWKLNPDPDLFDNELLPALRQSAESALRSGEPQAIADWFEVYAVIVGVADEELADLSLDIVERHPDAAAGLPERLSVAANAQLSLQFEPWAVQALDGGAGSLADRVLRAPTRIEGLVAALPVLGVFEGDRTFTSRRGYPVVAGTLTLSGRDGAALGQFRTNTGGGAATYRKTNGPIPPGTYVVSTFRLRDDKAAMIRDGVGYSFNLDPAGGTPVFGRSLFRIHPDGASLGTNGCLGIDEDGALLKGSRDTLRQLLSGGGFLVSVAYEGLG